jgi:hypothetical protein
MKNIFKLLLALSMGMPCLLSAQEVTTKVNADTTKKQAPKSLLKPYTDVVTDQAVSQNGLFTVHKINDRYLIELPDSLMGREILAVTRYVQTPVGASFYNGEIVNQQSVYFEKGPENKVFLRVALYVNQGKDSTESIFKAVQLSNLATIVGTFDIKSLSKDGKGVVIDVTDYFKGDNQIVSLPPMQKQRFKFAALAPDKSYITRISTYPINTEVRTVKTFSAAPAGPTTPYGPKPIPAATETGFITIELNTSFLLLPKVPMEKRYFDERVGFFADEYTPYTDSDQRVKTTSFAVRWRLEPKEKDRARFERGELVEPAKPILFYIDPATPKKWRKYLIAGVNDWNAAFEQAGFKNAISAKEWPENDTTMSMEDARFSVIRYFASPTSNAYGPNVHDPRSGEILESHIGWYHNVMKVAHDWYMVQAGAIDPRARKMQFEDELMGELIRFISSHEVGHTLGLRHNMGSSSQTPVEKLRDKAWLEANGHTVSIMDYARFNYVAQPEDNVGPKGIYPRIGPYDKWAIEWGYGPVKTRNAEEERIKRFEMTTARLKADPTLWFGGEGSFEDPRSQSEDLGDNSMKASTYGIKNLKRVMAGLKEWTREDGDTYTNFQDMYKEVVEQYKRYMYHVLKNISGVYFTNKASSEPGDLFEPVEKLRQKEAVNYMLDQVFTTPVWLIDTKFINKINIRPVSKVLELQEPALNQMLKASRLMNVIECASRSSDPYTLPEYLSDITSGIWSELDSRQSISIYRRNLQKAYIGELGRQIRPELDKAGQQGAMAITQPSTQNSDVQSVIRQVLAALKTKVDMLRNTTTDIETKYHLEDVSMRLENILDNKS